MTEQKLLDNIKKGTEESYKQLFDKYYLQLTIYANKFVNDLDQSRELVQDLFVRIYEKRDQINIHTSLKAHLYQSIRNSCINYIKQRQTQATHHENIKYINNGSDINISEQILETELEYQVLHALKQLPDQCRKVFQMNRFEGLKNQEIADRLSISKRTVETHISKALKILRKELSTYLKIAILVFTQLF